MKFSKITRISALLLSLLMVLLVGCGTNGKSSASVGGENTPWAVKKYDTTKILDSNDQYITDKLTPVTVAEMKTVGDKKVAYYLGKPYLYHAIHLRYDHLLNANLTDERRNEIFEEEFRLAKEAGYDTVSLYLSMGRLYDGEKVDFSEIEYQYNLAKKYDLNVVITWFGHMVCGFGGYFDWQTKDLEKYPPLKDENGNIIFGTGYAEGEMIPDFSAQGFIDDESYVLKQLCAWLNVNDTDRRTIGIQIEDEPNNMEGGNGLWYSQYENVRDFIGLMAKTVKESAYSMLTYTTLMSSGWDQKDENGEQTVFKNQVKGFIDLPYLDSTGYGIYTPSITPSASVIEQEDNPRFMVGFGACVWSVPAQTNYLLSNGYGICYYHVLQYNDSTPGTSGLYRFGNKTNPFILRDGTQKLVGQYDGALEVVSSEFFVMNNSIKALKELIAVSSNASMTYFNNSMATKFSESKALGGKTFTFKTECKNDKYGSTALLIKGSDSKYYAYASKDATITIDGGIKSASEGIYKDGKWIKTKDVKIADGVMTFEAGKAYQIIV